MIIGIKEGWKIMETMKDSMKLLAIFGASIALAIGLCFYECKVDETVWNNGICHCGGEYEFSNASKRKSQTYYYYYCDDCGNVIETISPQKK